MREIDKKIIDKIINDDTIEKNSTEELRLQLENECSKENPDYTLIDELSIMIVESEGGDLNEIDILEKTAEINRKINISHRRIIPKWITAISACLVIFLGLNIYSVRAWNMNIFSAAVRYVKNGVIIDLKTIELPTSEDDPYGLKAKCAEYDVYPLIPEYIPSGFALKKIDTVPEENFTLISFYFEKDSVKLNFSFIKYLNYDDIPPGLIPSDEFNITRKFINGNTIYISKEDNQFTANFLDNNIVCVVFSDGLDYTDCEEIIESMK